MKTLNFRALCEQYEFDKEITALLDRCELHLLPSLNPDGACRKTRANANNKDLNRCFPDWSSLGAGDLILEDREPEVAAVIRHLASNHFVLSADFHDGWTMVTFPWDDSPACTDNLNAVCSEDATFYDLALKYAYNHSFMYKGYKIFMMLQVRHFHVMLIDPVLVIRIHLILETIGVTTWR